MYKNIKIENKDQLLKLESIAEKLNHLCLTLRINLDEKKMFSNNSNYDLFDNVIEFFLDYSDELNMHINISSVGDTLQFSKSTIKMLEKIVAFYEIEIKESNSNEVEQEIKECKELLEYMV
jgi:hypothetical protein